MEEIRSRYEHYSMLFGRTVDVTVNRPLGSPAVSRHGGQNLRKKNYPVNCGYLTKTLTNRGFGNNAFEPYYQYVYVLGIDRPVDTFRGQIIGVIHREAFGGMRTVGTQHLPVDRWDRLIIAPEGVEIYEPEIRNAVAFSERAGNYKLYCMYEKSCGAVMYCHRDSGHEYLLIKNRSGHIGFPKGHVELGEDERATMTREILEETALRVEPDLSFREEYHYVLWNVVHKTAVYSIAQFSADETVHTRENEIFGYWLVDYQGAKQLLSYENDRRVLDRAEAWLTEHGDATR